MNDIQTQPLEIEKFYANVRKKVNEGLPCIDAVQHTMLVEAGEISRLASIAIDKYNEAIYERTELSKQPNIDECALASMGTLWHDEHFDGNSDQMVCSEEETFLDSLYFILKYADSNNPLEEALKANDSVCGDKVSRSEIIKMGLKG